MFAWFKKVFNFFDKKREPISNESYLQEHLNRTSDIDIENDDDKTKFTIKQSERKKFHVKGAKDISPQGSSSESGKLKAITKTRPKKCPYCRTENKITFTTEKKWKCKACGHEWQ
ncbi:MAG: hypothetical protein KAI83_20055 [Thiomargarita sp.]|nr:hypothetical protein [Thiomargarita sp.]